MSRTSPRLMVSVVVVAAAWCVATLVFVLAWSAVNHLVFAGPYAGLFAGDQLRYLAWIREAGLHGLIADPYRAGAPHVYLQPLFLVSGLLWRAGLSVQLAYLVWTPVALIALIWGYAVFTGRFLAGRTRATALAIGLLYFSPLVALLDYGGIVNADGANQLVIAAGHGAPYWQAWGFLPTVIALGLMPAFMLGVEAIVGGDRARRRVILTALAGSIVAWLHPWGGIELVVVAVGLIALRRMPLRASPILIPAVVTALPLAYYAILARVDPVWSLSQLRAGTAGPGWPLLVAFGPLVLISLPAIRRPRTVGEQILVLWIAAAVVSYLALPGSRDAALDGISLPLAILAVQGWQRRSLPRTASWVAVALAIVPGAVYSADTFWDLFRSHDYAFALSRGEQRAVNSLADVRGKVLATRYLAGALPALAGLLDGRVVAAGAGFFDQRVSQQAADQRIDASHVSVVISDCLRGRSELSPVLAPLQFRERRIGCARVYRR